MNPPGLTLLDYRAGDFASFRAALLRARPGEVALADWHPTAEGDLALQLLEWWAYLADVLELYNERALHEVLLRTATQPADVRRIVRLLGYRPRPGIGATGVLAALTDASRPFIVPRGLPVQGAGGPGEPPQIFEVDVDVEIGLGGVALPASARFPAQPAGIAPTPAYSKRDVDGRLQNSVAARGFDLLFLPLIRAGQPVVIAIEGVVTNLEPDDTVLCVPRDWDGSAATALAGVHAVEPTWDDHGRAITQVTLNPGKDLPTTDYKVVKATKSAHLWLYHDRYPGPKSQSGGGLFAQIAEQIFDPGGLFSGGISHTPPEDPHVLVSKQSPGNGKPAAHLEGIVRGISPGDPVLFEKAGIVPSLPGLFAQMVGAGPAAFSTLAVKRDHASFLTQVTGYSEEIWYANPPEGDRIGQGPPIGPPSHGLISGGASPIPIPHSKIEFLDPVPGPSWAPDGIATLLDGPDDVDISAITVHYAWQDVGALVPTPTAATPVTTPEVPAHADVPPATPVIVEDVTGAGVPGWAGSVSPEGPPLQGPLKALINLLPVSRGQTVANEPLGSGDPTLTGQEFALARSPLTYLTDARAPSGYASTLRVRVAGIEWHEVPSFYGQPPAARVFVTREDDAQRTHVRFGDGVNGARLPAGAQNVVATYRVGSGAAVPPIGALTTILRPLEGLSGLRNPIQPGGGADPDPPEQIRRYAPRSVLAFDRAISGDDYETIAAQTPGVNRARAVWAWNDAQQRTLVTVYVGDDDTAVTNARAALRAKTDPNRPVVVALASPLFVDLTLVLEVHPDYDAAAVQAAVTAALLDPLAQPFGTEVVRIGETVYDSQIYDACLRVPGVVAVHGLQFAALLGAVAAPVRELLPPGFDERYAPFVADDAPVFYFVESGERHDPTAGRFYLLRGDRLHITTEVARHE